MTDDDPQARVEMINGQLVLIDPIGVAVAEAAESHNRKIDHARCHEYYLAARERIAHFVQRVVELRRTGMNTVIVILEVDSRFGRPLADALMPGHRWQPYRDRGEVPIARGLAERGGIEDAIGVIDSQARADLLKMRELAVVVVAGESCCVYRAVA